jgi:hypothetical protein
MKISIFWDTTPYSLANVCLGLLTALSWFLAWRTLDPEDEGDIFLRIND